MNDGPSALDLATDAIVRDLGLPLAHPDVADAVDRFTDELGRVLDETVNAVPEEHRAHVLVLAGQHLAADDGGAVGAGWAAYVAAIRFADRALGAASASMVAEVESFAADQDRG
jgi:hypothetical protein